MMIELKKSIECEHCGKKLTDTNQVYSMLIPDPHITNYYHNKTYCSKCYKICLKKEKENLND